MESASWSGSMNNGIDSAMATRHPWSSSIQGRTRSRTRTLGSSQYASSSVMTATSRRSGTSGWPTASGMRTPPGMPILAIAW